MSSIPLTREVYRLTDRERKLVIKAAQRIQQQKTRYSCWALNHVEREYNGVITGLSYKYCQFYGKDGLGSWFNLKDEDKNRHNRVMCLLFFAEFG